MKNVLLILCSIVLILSSFARSESKVITGQIIDAGNGQTLEGANILLEGTTIGTVSDQYGKFTLKNVPAGNYVLKVTFIGYKPEKRKISFIENKSISVTIKLESTILQTESITITAEADPNRAIVRETPIAFTVVNREELAMKYTTSDLPELIKDVPGVWTSSAGLGESEIWIRGFGADKIRFMVNGIQMNEPEDNNVYWSNWTGLSNAANSVQVQRGPGFSLYGSGAFGGSVHIETMGVVPQRCVIARVSFGFYNMRGIESGPIEGKVANGIGTFDYVYKPVNHTYSVQYNSGPLFSGRFNWSFMIERKAGDSYIVGTDYDGYAFSLEAQGKLGNHKLNFSFVGSPQMHNQALTLQDIDLLKTLGREYNRNNHKWQENYYFKPLLHLKHEWNITDKKSLINSIFFTYGKGADQTIVNPIFNTETGEVGFQPVSKKNDCISFGKHALYLLDNYGVIMSGFELNNPDMYWGYPLTKEFGADGPENIFAEQYAHSWQRKNRRDHYQFGISTHYQDLYSNWLQYICGAEAKYWSGHRSSEAWNLYACSRYHEGQTVKYDETQHVYDYDTEVANGSVFGRLTIKPKPYVTIQTGGQFYITYMRVRENPIDLFDLGDGQFMNIYVRTSADQLDIYGVNKYTDDDYWGTFNFFVPWIGSNLNLTEKVNLFTNYAMSKKEPKILDWYDPESGPKLKTNDKDGLKPESVYSIEGGLGYTGVLLQAKANYYYTHYEDKIESVIDINERHTTMNAGQAVFQGVECEVKAKYDRFDFTGSTMFSRNRWKKMNVQQIFDANADDVVNKVVPFSPEQTLSASLGYNFESYRIGLKLNWWDEYYGTYTNKYTKADGTIAEAKLPYFFDISAQLSYHTRIEKVGITFRIDLNNITNRADNYMRAQYSIDYTRNDALAGKYHWYVLQAPLFNAFFTTEFSFQ